MSEVNSDLADRDVGHPLGVLIRRFARPHGVGFGVGLLALVLARIPQRVPALLIGVSLDALLLNATEYTVPLVPQELIPETVAGQIWFTAGIFAGAVVVESALDWVARWLYNRSTLRALHDVRTATYETTLGLEMSYFDDTQSGQVMSVLNNDVNNLEDLTQGVFTGANVVAQVAMAFAFMLLLNWQLALVVATIPLVFAAMSRVYATMLEPRFDAVRESVGQVNARLEDSIEGIATVKANTREDRERGAVAEQSAAYKATRWSVIRLMVVFNAVTWFVGRASEHALLLLGGIWILSPEPPLFFTGELTPGILLAFFMYTHSFLIPIRQLATRVVNNVQNAHASAKRVVNVLTSPAVVDEDSDADELTVREGRVSYDDVSFSYPGADEQTLRDVDFEVEPGELVGIVGSTGAGKSTLMKLLFRFYDPDDGAIRVDGTDVSDVTIRSLREHVGYVSQDPFLFDGTVRENVAYATPDATHRDVVRTSKLAGAHEFVTDLADGYDTQVGERGVKLSGGQRQRIAIARAVLRDPEILVLDEATSHVDNETELQIQQSLDDIAGDRTTFAIAHRLSTVRDADRILVLDDGRIAEQGSHDDLIEADGLYADLWRIQVGDVASVSETFLDDVERTEVAK